MFHKFKRRYYRHSYFLSINLLGIDDVLLSSDGTKSDYVKPVKLGRLEVTVSSKGAVQKKQCCKMDTWDLVFVVLVCENNSNLPQLYYTTNSLSHQQKVINVPWMGSPNGGKTVATIMYLTVHSKMERQS